MMPESENKDRNKKPLCQAPKCFPCRQRGRFQEAVYFRAGVLSSLERWSNRLFQTEANKGEQSCTRAVGQSAVPPGHDEDSTTRILDESIAFFGAALVRSISDFRDHMPVSRRALQRFLPPG